jgi:FtsP/CotA-like multicopper oxidase with cupredoxin domain
MNRAQTILLTTVVLSIALTSIFAIDFDNNSIGPNSLETLPFFAQADKPEVDKEPIHHTITMQAVKMPDGMYAYAMVSYTTSDNRDLVDHPDNENPSDAVYSTKPSIPGPTLVFTERDTVSLTLQNNACDDFVVDDLGAIENSLVGVHVHGVHYDIQKDATYDRMNMNGDSAAACGKSFDYFWAVTTGTEGTWPYHDHTFKINEVGAEDIGLFGTVIVNPYNGKVDGLVKENGQVGDAKVEDIDKEFVLWMVSSETLGRSVFYGMEIDNAHSTNPGKQTALWVNPPLYTEEGKIVRYHVLGLGDETHSFHLHGHRWVDDQDKQHELIDVKEIAPLQRHSFLVKASDNNAADDTPGTEAWMYHCHVDDHMKAGMSGMMMVVDDDELPDVGAVFTISDEPGLWFKTLDAGALDVLDEVIDDALEGTILENAIVPKAGIGFAPTYLGILDDGDADDGTFGDTKARSLAVINKGETVLYNMKDSHTKHTITTLLWPTAGSDHFVNTELPIRGSSFVVNEASQGMPMTYDEPGLYVNICAIHPYMFSAILVDDPTTNLPPADGGLLEDGTIVPLIEIGSSFETLIDVSGATELGDGVVIDAVTYNFKSELEDGTLDVIPGNNVEVAIIKTLLQTHYHITDPAMWKDYTQDYLDVNLPPAFLTTEVGVGDIPVIRLDTTNSVIAAQATALLGITNFTGILPIGLDMDSRTELSEPTPPSISGVGEVWVNTQFEQTLNKNNPGTPQDKPGTTTVIDASDWSIKKKIALPELNMNHPHNMWTDSKNEFVYQTQWFDTTMASIDRESGELVKEVFTGQSPSHVMTLPDGTLAGNIMVAMNGEEQVVEFDPNTLEMTRQISTGVDSHPHGHWISYDGKHIVTPNPFTDTSTIVEFGETSGEVDQSKVESITEVSTQEYPIATGMNSKNDEYYVATFLGSTIDVFDTDGVPVDSINLLEEALGVGMPIQTPVSPDGEFMVTANVLDLLGFGGITVVQTSSESNPVKAQLPCDPGCHGVQWGAKLDPHEDEGKYLAYVSSKFSNALIVIDPDPINGGEQIHDGSDAIEVGRILLTEQFATDTDDQIIGLAGMGGQGVLAIPNVYDGWIQQTVDICDDDGEPDPCSQEVANYLYVLTEEQKEASIP